MKYAQKNELLVTCKEVVKVVRPKLQWLAMLYESSVTSDFIKSGLSVHDLLDAYRQEGAMADGQANNFSKRH
jgi:hypothetical protein